MKTTKTIVTIAFMLFIITGHTQVIDKGGRTYKTIKIGNQEWMAENLNVSVYRNGDPIPQIQEAKGWSDQSDGACCYYDNSIENRNKYGMLYNWFAVNDPRGLAPAGWHVPSDAEWKQLIDFLGGEEACGIAIRSRTGWRMDDEKANSAGFEGLPAGSREFDGTYYGINNNSEWWSATESNTYNAWFCFLNNYFSNLGKGNYDKLNGFSVRCIKD